VEPGSSVKRRNEEKARFGHFSFALGAFNFFALLFLRAPVLFFGFTLLSATAKKERPPTSG
jgi:hypothetical protein